jgi:hypothetical protein
MITSSGIQIGNGDELLVMDTTPCPMRIPFDEISYSTATGSGDAAAHDEEGSVVSAISDLDDIDENESILKKPANHHSFNVVETVPRSIFSSYWKGDYTNNRDPAAVCYATPRKRSIGIQAIRPEQDPYLAFGIKHPQKQVDQKRELVSSSSSSSLNTYERIIQAYEQRASPSPVPLSHSSIPRSPFESRPLWMSFFSGNQYLSEPQLLSSVHDSRTARANRSDTALAMKPQKSCLRRGRFTAAVQSTSTIQNPSTTARPEVPQLSLSSPARVCFQPKIEVHVFQPPVEQWSTSGWSSLFG